MTDKYSDIYIRTNVFITLLSQRFGLLHVSVNPENLQAALSNTLFNLRVYIVLVLLAFSTTQLLLPNISTEPELVVPAPRTEVTITIQPNSRNIMTK